jgi:hypothetical protein
MWYWDMLHQICKKRGIRYRRTQSGIWLIRNSNGVEWVARSNKDLCEKLSWLLSNPR